MSERKVFYRDHLDQDRPACGMQSIEAVLAQARSTPPAARSCWSD